MTVRPNPTGQRDALGREIKVSDQTVAGRASAPPPPASGFRFNGDMDDLDQVAAHFDDYADAVQRAAAADDSFRRGLEQMRGMVAGIAGDDEDVALRLLGKAWNDEWERRGTALAEENYDAYQAVHDEIVAAGDYPYNDSFRGRIPGIAHETDVRPGVQGNMQDHAIYRMQGMRHVREMQAEVDAFTAEGAQPITRIEGRQKFTKVMQYGFYMGGSGVKVLENVTLVEPEYPGGMYGVIRKGGRTPTSHIDGNLIGLPA